MEGRQVENQQRQRLSQISRDEVDVINDIRELNFGKINIVIQDGVIVSKEITRVIKRTRSNGRRGVDENKNNASDNGYDGSGVGSSNENEMY